MTGTSASSERRESRRWGRFVSLSGFALLCMSFFLPQARGCGQPLVPSEMTANTHGAFLLHLGLPFLAAIVLLPIYTFHTVRWLVRTPRARRAVAIAVCILSLAALIPGALLMAVPVATGGFGGGAGQWGWVACAGVAVLAAVLACVGLISRSVGRKAAGAVFGVGTASLAFFAFFLLLSAAMYGMVVSAAACLLIAVGSAADWLLSGPIRDGPRAPS